ncbi:MAG: serine hydrolase [Verrucomicrobiota bacterium]
MNLKQRQLVCAFTFAGSCLLVSSVEEAACEEKIKSAAQDKRVGLSASLKSKAYAKIDAVLLLKNGETLFEEYFNGYDEERLHDFASVTKSITSLLVGAAIHRGEITDVDAPILPFYAKTKYSDQWKGEKRTLTFRHLLTMQHGLACDDYNDPGMRRFNSWLEEEDPIQAALDIPSDRNPGEVSIYCTASTQLLRLPLEKATGKTIEEFADNVLFGPLGISKVAWQKNQQGNAATGYGIEMRPRDVAKIGKMIENRGVWEGKRIVSENWLEQSFQRHGSLLGIDYGYLWYGERYEFESRSIQSHLAMGHGGQFLILFPGLDAIVVIAASDYDFEIDFYSLVRTKILPVLTS